MSDHRAYGDAQTLVDILRGRAQTSPDQIIYTYLSNDGVAADHLTLATLDQQARTLAARLQHHDLAGQRALLLYPPGLDYITAFFGCLYAGVVAVPAYPPQLNRPAPRLQAIVADAQAAVALTTTPIWTSLAERFASAPELARLRWLTTDGDNLSEPDAWDPPDVDGTTLAFLQYTSGSTSTPKGVMLTHSNLLHNSALIQHCFGHSSSSRGVIWLPPYHDMGLIGGIIQPLYGGFPVTLMAPVTFLQRPLRWLDAISQTRGTTSGGPNFAYELCVRKITPEQRATLDLSSWEVAFTGAEPIRYETLERFAEAFGPCGFRREAFYPCYGLAEATLIVAGGAKAAPPISRAVATLALEHNRVELVTPESAASTVLVSSGRSLSAHEIAIVHPETRMRYGSGEVGEIWVRGPSIAQGYWSQPEATEQTFAARLSDTDGGPFLRTGDLGFFQDGELFVTGRLKDLIIIRGRNFYPQDIELTVEGSHPALRLGSGAAFTVDHEGEQRLVVVQEVERQHRKTDPELLAGAIRSAVQAQHELAIHAVVLLKPGAIPKTSSGKIQRHACRAGFLAGTLEPIGSSIVDARTHDEPVLSLTSAALLSLPEHERHTTLETYIRQQLARMLPIGTTRLDSQQSLSTLGLDSLQAVELTNQLEADLQVVVPMTTVLQGPSIARFSAVVLEQIAGTLPEGEAPLVIATPPPTIYPLSYGQRALWFLHQLTPDSAAYHIASAVQTRSDLDIAALHWAVQQLVDRHPALRTTFERDAQGEPFQQVQTDIPQPLSNIDATGWNEATLRAQLLAEAQRPFNLQRGPLLRLTLYQRAHDAPVILLVVHHIISDFWSLAVLLNELSQLYAAHSTAQSDAGLQLASLPAAYSDFVQWQMAYLNSPASAQDWAYWQQQLADTPDGLDLPTDRPRPAVQTYRGATETAYLSAELTEQIKTFSAQRGLTLYMTLLTAFQIVLAHHSGQRDILVGTTTAGRNRARLAGLAGYFVNPVVLRADLADNPSIAALLEQVRQTVLHAFAHQDYPFPLLVERLQPRRDPARSPLFQVMFSWQQAPQLDQHGLASFALNIPGARLDLGQLPLTLVELEQQTAQFDLTLLMAELPDGLGAVAQYNPDLFDAATIRRMLGHLQVVLATIVAQPERRVADLTLLTAAEQQELQAWNTTAIDYPRQLCVHELIAAQAVSTPDAVAVSFDGEQPTYRQLDERSNQLAQHLRMCGVGPETLVALCVERSVALVVGLLGVLKAGGAYVPLDPSYPTERIAYVLRDAGATLLLTERSLLPTLPSGTATVLQLDADWPLIAQQPPIAPDNTADPTNLAYVIYTSGSTGQPKGVQISHRAVVNFLHAMQRQPGISAEDVLLSVTTIAFDIAALEIFLPLITGAQLLLVPRTVTVDGAQLAKTIDTAGVTMMQATPATWRLLLAAGWTGSPSLRMLCGGEAFPPDLARELQPCGAVLWNMYGPTETTIWSAVQQVTAVTSSVPIGHPIANTQLFILDAQLHPTPVGVIGELYIGGDGLARGYLNRPALTAERFLPDPYSADSGARLYRTGDLARWLPNGAVECLGRNDQQVKVRGYRIELGEIEAQLQQHPLIKQAVVVAREDTPGNKRLIAYVVGEPRTGDLWATQEPRAEAEGTGRPLGEQGNNQPQFQPSELRDFLKERLPDYMIPAVFVTLPELPLTANGKVNRLALPTLTPPSADMAQLLPQSSLEREIAAIWRAVLGIDQVGRNDNFFDLGGHSVLVAQVHAQLRDQLNVELSLIDLFKYPTISALASHLGHHAADASPQPQATLSRRATRANDDPAIAIIGMSGRFPGAPNVTAFWQNLREGVEAISFFSDEDLLAVGVDPATLRDPHYVKARGMLSDIDMFDASFFGLNPREAAIMDPQHRIFLECAWAALEDAGYDAGRYADRIGIFASVGLNTYLLHANRALLEAAGQYQAFIGNDKDFVPTRVSYKLGLRGPSVNVQTACSSSLVAVHLACQSLLSDECEMVLAGGIAVNVPHRAGYRYEPGGIASPDGHCRAFDAEAQGAVFGSGVGIVVLKRLQRALDDGDTIYAVIKGSAINNDGANKIGYTAPSIDGQAEVIDAALAAAQVDPATIGYVEAHGTGTTLGDPIEVAALTQAFRRHTAQTGYCALGSAKTNIGHLDTAAGVAGLIKTVLALKHAQLPPSLNFRQPNPKIDFVNSPFYVNTNLFDWPRNGDPRRAGVSSFGIGGTNAHVIIEEAPAQAQSSPAQPWQLLLLSAKTPAAMERASANLAEFLAQQPNVNLADVAYTLQVGRKTFTHRRALVARDHADALAQLRTSGVELAATPETGSRPVAFLFPGQGAQYVGMGRDLYASEPVFRAVLDRCCTLLHPALGLDLRAVLYPAPDDAETASAQLTQTALAQPALFVVSYALAQLWQHWGVTPSALLGHSVGELVAATLADVFTLPDALALVATRGRLMQRMPAGAMLAVALPAAALEPLLGPDLALAAVNGPTQCVVSGPSTAVAALADVLTARGVQHRPLHTSHAFHSPMMEPVVAALGSALQHVHLHPPTLPFISNVSGTWITAAQATDPAYWTQQLRQPVQFAAGLDTLLDQASDLVLLEVGPGATLSTLARQQPASRTIVTTLRHAQDQRADRAVLLSAIGILWSTGVELSWSQLTAHEQQRHIPLPTYPFERERHWIDAAPVQSQPQLQPGKQPNPADWLYAPLWKQSVPPAALALAPSSWLVLADVSGVSAQLASQLRELGHSVTLVFTGTGFNQRGVDYIIDPGTRADYDALFDALRQEGRLPAQIVHAWSVSVEQPGNALEQQVASFYSLIYLAQALEAQHVPRPIQISVLSNNMQRVTSEPVLHPGKALLLGPCRVIPHEYPELRCRSIDLLLPPADSSAADDLIDLLLSELSAPASEPVVAYRGLERWVQSYDPLHLDGPARLDSRLQSHGIYLITGGLGGIGLVLAEHLARAVQARLVLVGRTLLPDRDRWAEWLVTHPDNDAISRKLRQVQALEVLGAEVLLGQADVTDEAQMQAVIDATRARFGTIHGVIHAAGIAGGGMIQLKTPQVAGPVLDPKVTGTLVLHQLLKDANLRFFVLCSSINAVIGGFGQVDYVAANAFMDAFAASHNSRRGTSYLSINWDRWQDVGMAVETEVSASFRELQASIARGTTHPLLGTCVTQTPERIVYRAEFRVAEQWVLAEHLIVGLATVPGTTYLEMARAALAEQTQAAAIELRDVVFVTPLVLANDEQREVMTVLSREERGYQLHIVSRALTHPDSAWQEHARATVDVLKAEHAPLLDLTAIMARCDRESILPGAATSHYENRAFLETGPRWDMLQRIDVGKNEALAALELAPQFAADLDQFKLHPALLDVATGSVQRLGKGNYLPLAYERLRIYRPLSSTCYSHIRYDNSDGAAREILTCDITILDAQGAALVEIGGFSMRRVEGDVLAQMQARVQATSAPALTLPAVEPMSAGASRSAAGPYLGIGSAEGAALFEQIVRQTQLARVIVSVQALALTIEQANQFTQTRIAADLEQITVAPVLHARPNVNNAYVAPSSELEQMIAAVWQHALGIDRVGIHDNFFELGGSSLTGIQIIAALKKQLSVDIPTVSIFEAPTVAALARYLSPEQPTHSSLQLSRDRAQKKLQRKRKA